MFRILDAFSDFELYSTKKNDQKHKMCFLLVESQDTVMRFEIIRLTFCKVRLKFELGKFLFTK